MIKNALLVSLCYGSDPKLCHVLLAHKHYNNCIVCIGMVYSMSDPRILGLILRYHDNLGPYCKLCCTQTFSMTMSARGIKTSHLLLSYKIFIYGIYGNVVRRWLASNFVWKNQELSKFDMKRIEHNYDLYLSMSVGVISTFTCFKYCTH